METLYLYLGIFGGFFAFGVPVVLSLAVSAIILLMINNIPLTIFAQQWLMSTDNFSLTAIFFFMLAGELMNVGGLTQRILGIASRLVGKRPGGLAIIVGIGSMLFASINGSAIATTVAVGSIMIPAMAKEGYDNEFSGAAVAAGGVVGPIIPPSIPLILFGTITGVAVSKLFVGGMFLGILIGIGQAAVSYYVSKKRGYSGGTDVKIKFEKNSWWAIVLPLLLFITITFGILTPNEASAFAVVYAFAISFFIYKNLDLKSIPQIMVRSFAGTAIVMAVVGAASVVAWILTSEQLPQIIANAILSSVNSQTHFMILTFVVLMIVGMIMDLTPAILILAPVFIEPIKILKIDPVYFGIFFCSTLVAGLITPPVGTLIYTGCSLTGRSFSQVSKELLPYTVVTLAMIVLTIFFPQIITFLPNLIFN